MYLLKLFELHEYVLYLLVVRKGNEMLGSGLSYKTDRPMLEYNSLLLASRSAS